MKYALISILSTAATCTVLSAAPAFAQVAGNPGDLHTRTLYMQQYKNLPAYTARAPEPANTGCDVVHDFNSIASHYQYIAVCPFLPFH